MFVGIFVFCAIFKRIPCTADEESSESGAWYLFLCAGYVIYILYCYYRSIFYKECLLIKIILFFEIVRKVLFESAEVLNVTSHVKLCNPCCLLLVMLFNGSHKLLMIMDYIVGLVAFDA